MNDNRTVKPNSKTFNIKTIQQPQSTHEDNVNLYRNPLTCKNPGGGRSQTFKAAVPGIEISFRQNKEPVNYLRANLLIGGPYGRT